MPVITRQIMAPRTTTEVLASMIAGHLAALPAAFIGDGDLDSPVGVPVALRFLFVQLFDAIGIPGLLWNKGGCGWGGCRQSGFEGSFLALV